MKFDELRSIGHNIADSLASGIGFLIGVYEMDVFGEAAESPQGVIEIDFLTGTSTGGQPSISLADAISKYGGALPSLCEKHGASLSDFHRLSVRYVAGTRSRHFVVTVEDRHGRSSADIYEGSPGKRIKVLDPLGRVRTNRSPVARPS
jgi:hypothetical protein